MCSHVKQEPRPSTKHWKKPLLESSIPRAVEKPSLVRPSLTQATFTKLVLSRATYLVSIGNPASQQPCVTCRALTIFIARFAASDVKDRQVASGNGACCP